MKETIIKNNCNITISERYRIPADQEKILGLWVDRIGSNPETEKLFPDQMRILNLYAAVAVIDGEGIFESTLTGRSELKAGDVIMLFPDIPARYGSASGWRTEWIVWQGHEADNMIRAGYFSPENPVIINGAHLVHDAFSRFERLLQREGADAALERKLVLQEMLLGLYKVKHKKNVYHEEIIKQAVSFIAGNIHKNLSVDQVAEKCRLSTVHFRRIFKAGTGFSPKDYIVRMKIAEAKSLLSEGMTAKAIADNLGFCDEFHFRNTFRRVTGIPSGKFI